MTKKRVVSRSSHVDPNKAGKRKAAGTREVYQGTIEAQWTCSSCGRTGIPGRQKRCPSCGNPKDTSEEYEAPAGHGSYLSEAELRDMGVDPKLHLSDETCEYCGAKLKPGTQKCPNCGAALGDVGYTTRHCPACGRESNEETCPNCGSPTEEKLVAHREAEAPPPPPPKPKATESKGLNLKVLLPIAIGVLFLCAITCLIAFVLFPRNETATVSGYAWERKILVQEHQYNRHEGWDPPADADIEQREERIHHHDQVKVGTEEECGYEEECETHSVYDHTETVCYDDGTCDEKDVYRDERECHDEYVCKEVPIYEDVPVYQTWYIYSVWEWVDLDPIIARGDDAAPYWPEVQLEDNQRENKRVEVCEIMFTNKKGKTFPYDLPCTDMGNYPHGSTWQIKRNAQRVNTVKPAN